MSAGARAGAISLVARAKVNLYLRVIGKRPDGYHDLETLFDRISLGDTVTLEAREQPGISMTCDRADLPADPANLAWRGAAAALEGTRLGVQVRLEKRVPSGAGLGGGSADAAAALVGTDELFALGLGERELLRRARSIGADVPFFVHGHLRDRESAGSGRMAIGKGVGELLAPVRDPPQLFYVLINPGFEVSTSWVFEAGGWGLTPSAPRGDRDVEGIDGTAIKSLEDTLGLLRNDLEEVTASRHPEILQLKQALMDAGARKAQMSGSGSTVFGVFATVGDAARAKDGLERSLAATKTRIFAARGE